MVLLSRHILGSKITLVVLSFRQAGAWEGDSCLAKIETLELWIYSLTHSLTVCCRATDLLKARFSVAVAECDCLRVMWSVRSSVQLYNGRQDVHLPRWFGRGGSAVQQQEREPERWGRLQQTDHTGVRQGRRLRRPEPSTCLPVSRQRQQINPLTPTVAICVQL